MAPLGKKEEKLVSWEEKRKELVSLRDQEKWQDILHVYKHSEDSCGRERWDCGLLWLRPSVRSLQFVGEQIRQYELTKLLSIGCGSGLLEWLIHCCTGIHVEGLEVDELWWNSRHAPPCFLPENQRHFLGPDENFEGAIPKDVALLFCYFNNEPAFHQYMDRYLGNCLIVIGPAAFGDRFPPKELIEGNPGQIAEGGRHCNPRPFSVKEPWILSAAHNVSTSPGDYIAVYTR
ncbi:uncharacterized protein LOC124163948 [Ischnura elegans]|uniref:uncharacterized protein LOC124163948 n=1 Tax=Ischnura elegans TaxID=197161 RepID=UPI001ED8AF9D|nr:uncharacterized protein LOC124163948 [Ischnura elegans]